MGRLLCLLFTSLCKHAHLATRQHDLMSLSVFGAWSASDDQADEHGEYVVRGSGERHCCKGWPSKPLLPRSWHSTLNQCHPGNCIPTCWYACEQCLHASSLCGCCCLDRQYFSLSYGKPWRSISMRQDQQHLQTSSNATTPTT